MKTRIVAIIAAACWAWCAACALAFFGAPDLAAAAVNHPVIGPALSRRVEAFLGGAQASPYVTRSRSVMANFAVGVSSQQTETFEVPGGVVVSSYKSHDAEERAGVRIGDNGKIQAVGIRHQGCYLQPPPVPDPCPQRQLMAVFLPHSPQADMIVLKMGLWAHEEEVAADAIQVVWLPPRHRGRRPKGR